MSRTADSPTAPAPARELTQNDAFDVAGPPSAPAIVLLHGSSESRRMWLPQVQPLSDSFRVITPDFPGHGALEHLPFHMDDVIARIAGLIDREAGGRAVLAGLSLGGYVAMEFAARHPEKLHGVVLLSCTAEPTGPGAAIYWVATGFMSVTPISWLSAMKRVMARLLVRSDLYSLIDGNYFRGGAEGCRAIMWASSIEKVRRYRGPVLFINGKRDYPFRSRERSFLAAAHEGRIELIPRAYHPCNLNDPARVTAAIRQFAETVTSARV